MNILTIRNAMIKRAAETDDDSWKFKLNPISHTVGANETLSGIAAQYGTTVDKLLEMNPSTLNKENKDKLRIGQEVFLPSVSDRRQVWIDSGFDPYDVYPLSDEQLQRQSYAEVEGNPNQVNPSTGATGPLQFKQDAIDEVNMLRAKENKTITDPSKKLPMLNKNDFFDWNTSVDSAQRLNQYWGRQYQLRTGKRWLGDMYARRHNTGNDWETNDRSLRYLGKMYSDKTSDALGLDRVPGGIVGDPGK